MMQHRDELYETTQMTLNTQCCYIEEWKGLLVDIKKHQFDLQIETKGSAARITIRLTIYQHVLSLEKIIDKLSSS